MFRRSTPRSAICLLVPAVIVLLGASGCAIKQEKQALTPQPDMNVVEIISHVKHAPSVITGGGMIYELFVGSRFAARYNEKSQMLRLTDIENENVCEYEKDGTLKLPEGADEGYLKYCAHLTSNTIEYINQ